MTKNIGIAFSSLGILVCVFIAIISITNISFNIIDIIIPDYELGSYYSYSRIFDSISLSTAFLIVVSPIIYILIRLNRKLTQPTEGMVTIGIRNAMLIAITFVSAIIIVITAAVVIFQFLTGEIQLSSFLKAVTLAVIALITFVYFLYDLKDYWRNNQKKANIFGLIVGLILITLIVISIIIVNPFTARERAITQENLYTLNQYKTYIDGEYRKNFTVPNVLETNLAFFDSNIDYTKLQSNRYQLCALLPADAPGKEYRDYPFTHFNYQPNNEKTCLEFSTQQ